MDIEKKYIVAYIDLLGTKEIIKKSSDTELFIIIYKQFVIAKEMLKAKEINFDKLQFKSFSDNFIVCIEVENCDLWESIYESYSTLSFFLKIFFGEFIKSGVLFRGGISMGSFYIDSNMLWGETLVDSVLLEEKIAIYPRIVFSEELGKYLYQKAENNTGRTNLAIFQDYDGQYCFDYFDYSGYEQNIELVNTAKRTNNNRLSKEHNFAIRQKLMWFDNYLKHVDKRRENYHEVFKISDH